MRQAYLVKLETRCPVYRSQDSAVSGKLGIGRSDRVGLADQLAYTWPMVNSANSWYVYIVRCADATLYTGIARDVTKRINEHNHSQLAARYTRARRPVVLVYSETCDSRSQALRREMAIKKLSRRGKEQLCGQRQVTLSPA